MRYTYFCKECEKEFEVVHGMSEDPLIECKECKNICTRIISGGAGVIFKGDGWAKDGYTKAPTPLQSDNPNPGTCMRIPEYKDKKTGKKLGFGTPELAGDN